MIQRILPAYYFSIEGLFLYFLLFLFYTRIGEIPSIPSFVAVLAVAYLFLLFGLKQKLVSGTLPFVGAVLSGGIAYVFGFTFMSIVLIAVFLFFRMTAFLKDPAMWKEERTKLAILFYCSAFVIFLEGWVYKFPFMNWLFGTVIIFTLLFSVGRFLQQVETNKNVRNVGGIAGVLGIAAALATAVTFLIPIAKWMVFTIFEGLFLIIGFLLTPIFNLVESIIIRDRRRAVDKDEFEQVEFTDDQKGGLSDTPVAVEDPIWLWLLLLAIVLFVIWFFVRKRKMNRDDNAPSSGIEIEHQPVQRNLGKKHRFFGEPAPNEYIRKLFFHFQIYAEKYGMGRYDHETVQEWFHRVNFRKDEDLFYAYDCVRYGEVIIPKDEAKHYEEIFEEMKREIKERKKNEKGKEA
ncbi:hypothetical protein ACFSO7_16495 [Bacillus sp. CGMCC 1.16607]|uniref:hypothetical protein n=1 Tax=Bacillus sp. CGMCC 1.16607 TaxID=3351842 RepID=UPI00362FD9E5